jgi:hypothetical protein
MKNLKLNTSSKYHFIIALIIGLWLVIFLVLIAPFDASDLSFSIRLQILPPYGIITFLAYTILIPFQNWVFNQRGQWNLALEFIFIGLFNILALIGSFAYYKTDIINGLYNFIKFTFEVYYPIFFILLPMILFLRWWTNKKGVEKSLNKIVLKGENKLDVLRISLNDLICISSADNYVEVSYLIDNTLHKKLLRITLKNVHPQIPSLLKTHRSYLINPTHFKDWKNPNIIYVSQIEVPVSKNYKKDVLAIHNHSSLKASNSPQS